MKIFKKIIIILLVLILLAGIIGFIVGYSVYSNALKEKPLISRMDEIENDEHFVPFSELPKGEVADVNKITAIMKGILLPATVQYMDILSIPKQDILLIMNLLLSQLLHRKEKSEMHFLPQSVLRSDLP